MESLLNVNGEATQKSNGVTDYEEHKKEDLDWLEKFLERERRLNRQAAIYRATFAQGPNWE